MSLPPRGAPSPVAPPRLKIYPLVTLLYRLITIRSDTRVCDDRSRCAPDPGRPGAGWSRAGLAPGSARAGVQVRHQNVADQRLRPARPDPLLQQGPLPKLAAEGDQQFPLRLALE